MKVLLDTHAFLWWASDRGRRLSADARATIEDPATEVYVSAVTGIEIAWKAALGRLILPAPPERYVPRRIARDGFATMPIELGHALRAGTLPPVHGDPWDRLLVAQAQLESMPIVTADPAIGRYDVEIVW